MKLKVVVHEAEEGGYWAEVPSIPGCATQGDSYEELLANVHEAVEGCLSVDVPACISVPVHGGALKRGLQKHLMKAAQIEDSEP